MVVIGRVANAGVQPAKAVGVPALLEIDELVRKEESPRDVDPLLGDAGSLAIALRDLAGPERLAAAVGRMFQKIEVVLPHEKARVVDRIGRQSGDRAEGYDCEKNGMQGMLVELRDHPVCLLGTKVWRPNSRGFTVQNTPQHFESKRNFKAA